MRTLLIAFFVLLGALTMGTAEPAFAGEATISAVAPAEAHGDCEDGCLFCDQCSTCITGHTHAAFLTPGVPLTLPSAGRFVRPKHHRQPTMTGGAGLYRPPRG